MSLNALWPFFHRGEKQNSSHFRAYCKGCVTHHEAQAELLDESAVSDDVDAGTAMRAKQKLFEEGAQIICFWLSLY
jgi:hypothetical protein